MKIKLKAKVLYPMHSKPIVLEDREIDVSEFLELQEKRYWNGYRDKHVDESEAEYYFSKAQWDLHLMEFIDWLRQISMVH